VSEQFDLRDPRIKATCANCGSDKREERELRDDGAKVQALCADCGCAAVAFADDSGSASMGALSGEVMRRRV
jgi:hypothetical protein